MSAPSITCPVCGMTSYNPTDVTEGYCGHCHDWTGPDTHAPNPDGTWGGGKDAFTISVNIRGARMGWSTDLPPQTVLAYDLPEALRLVALVPLQAWFSEVYEQLRTKVATDLRERMRQHGASEETLTRLFEDDP